MSALAIHLYLQFQYFNLIFNTFGVFYRIIVIQPCSRNRRLPHRRDLANNTMLIINAQIATQYPNQIYAYCKTYIHFISI